MNKINLLILLNSFGLIYQVHSMNYFLWLGGYNSLPTATQKGALPAVQQEDDFALSTVEEPVSGKRTREGSTLEEVVFGKVLKPWIHAVNHFENSAQDFNVVPTMTIPGVVFTPGLIQSNGWECGYKALFHAYARIMRLDFNEKLRSDDYYKFITELLSQEEFERWNSNKISERLLSEERMKTLIEYLDLQQYVVVVDNASRGRNTIVTDPSVLKMIADYKCYNKPCWVLFIVKDHWICLEFIKNEVNEPVIHYFNSLPLHEETDSCHAIERMQDYFCNKVPMPELLQIEAAEELGKWFGTMTRRVRKELKNDKDFFESEYNCMEFIRRVQNPSDTETLPLFRMQDARAKEIIFASEDAINTLLKAYITSCLQWFKDHPTSTE